MKLMRLFRGRRPDAVADRNREAARLVSWYIGRSPAPYIAPLSKTALVLAWLLGVAIFLGVLLLLAWLGSVG
jgi:hypothetical protein